METCKTEERQRARNAVRSKLRALTRIDHDAVDKAFAGYDLRVLNDYRAFLSAHARVLPGLEQKLLPAKLLQGWLGRTEALLSDLKALEVPVPQTIAVELPATPGSRWGALYVLEGSRLGGAVLSKNVGKGFPAAYLSATHEPGGWPRLLGAIEEAAEGQSWVDQAVAGAKMVFAAYARAADDSHYSD